MINQSGIGHSDTENNATAEKTHRVPRELKEQDRVLEEEPPQRVVLLRRGAALPRVQEGAQEIQQQPERRDGSLQGVGGCRRQGERGGGRRLLPLLL